MTTDTPLRALEAAGQAVWLDFLDRRILDDGTLSRLIERDGITGLTSNPTIFEKAIGEGGAYDEALKGAAGRGDAPLAIYERLAVADIQRAADLLRPTYDRLAGRDGFASLEVSPALAMDPEGTVAEARRLWRAVDRPNVMIKVPGTAAGPPAIRALIAEGVNVNVTLLFGLDAWQAVAEAHMAGLEDRLAAGGDIRDVAGVASFFVSRIDTKIDAEIDARLEAAPDNFDADALKALRGRVAIANARRAYRRWLEMVSGPRWRRLADAGAAPQRLLWASTGVKDKAYRETMYAEALIGPQTIDTLPPKTLDAFRAHGVVAPTLTDGADEADRVLAEAERLGLDLDGVTTTLVDEGVAAFAKSFDALMAAVAGKSRRLSGAA